jgi:hypothetical protein
MTAKVLLSLMLSMNLASMAFADCEGATKALIDEQIEAFTHAQGPGDPAAAMALQRLHSAGLVKMVCDRFHSLKCDELLTAALKGAEPLGDIPLANEICEEQFRWNRQKCRSLLVPLEGSEAPASPEESQTKLFKQALERLGRQESSI